MCVRCRAKCCKSGVIQYPYVEMMPRETAAIEAARRRGLLESPDSPRILMKGDSCAALEGDECVLHPDKPAICRIYPFQVMKTHPLSFRTQRGCLAVREFAVRNPDKLVPFRRALFLHVENIQKDPVLGEAFGHALAEARNNYSAYLEPHPLIAIGGVEDLSDEPVVRDVIIELEGKGHSFSWRRKK